MCAGKAQEDCIDFGRIATKIYYIQCVLSKKIPEKSGNDNIVIFFANILIAEKGAPAYIFYRKQRNCPQTKNEKETANETFHPD